MDTLQLATWVSLPMPVMCNGGLIDSCVGLCPWSFAMVAACLTVPHPPMLFLAPVSTSTEARPGNDVPEMKVLCGVHIMKALSGVVSIVGTPKSEGVGWREFIWLWWLDALLPFELCPGEGRCTAPRGVGPMYRKRATAMPGALQLGHGASPSLIKVCSQHSS